MSEIELPKHPKFINLLENPPRRFGRLQVLSYNGKKQYNGYSLCSWNCICDCGKEKIATTNNLISGSVSSCGCLGKERNKEKSITHGMTKTKTYSSWTHMKGRCYNKNHIHYEDYGGRGITVCDRWLESFENFYEDMGEIPSNKHSLDRLDNEKGYFLDNCRWATQKEQRNNSRQNVYLEFNGEILTAKEWSEKTGISHVAILARIKYGWDVEDILTTPVQKRSIQLY